MNRYLLLAVLLFICIGSGVSAANTFSNGVVKIDDPWIPGELGGEIQNLAGDDYRTNITELYINGNGRLSNSDLCVMEGITSLRILKVSEHVEIDPIYSDIFWYHSNIREITLPKLTTIGKYAFHACTSLTSVNLPALTTIGKSAFQRCTSLTSVNLPALTTIGGHAFLYCTSLTSVQLPALATIEGCAFSDCAALESVNLPALTTFGDPAFDKCTSLTSVQLPALTTIESSAFDTCTALASVNLPALTTIGGWAFPVCTSLTSVNLPALTTIGGSAFSGCTALSSVNLPALTTIGVDAFGRENLGSAFGYKTVRCTSLTSADLPKLIYVGRDAFEGCDALTTVNLPALTTIGGMAFSNCDSLTSVRLPALTTIGNDAFRDCDTLTSANLPALTTIGEDGYWGGGCNAFYSCDALTSVKLPVLSSFSNIHGMDHINNIYASSVLKNSLKELYSGLLYRDKIVWAWNYKNNKKTTPRIYTVLHSASGVASPPVDYKDTDIRILAYDLFSGNPVANASVQMDGAGKTTDAKGIAQFFNVSPGDHTIRIDAENYETVNRSVKCLSHGQMNLSYHLKPVQPASGSDNKPKVTGVSSKYSSLSREAWFLHGVNFSITYKAEVDWSSLSPGQIIFTDSNGKEFIADENGEVTIDMGVDLAPRSRLSVTAITADDISSEAVDANVEVMLNPASPLPGFSPIYLKEANDGFSYSSEISFGVSDDVPSKNDNFSSIPKDIPFFGGQSQKKFNPKITIKVKVENTTAFLEVSGGRGIKKDSSFFGKEVSFSCQVESNHELLSFSYSHENGWESSLGEKYGLILKPAAEAGIFDSISYRLVPCPVIGFLPVYFRSSLGGYCNGELEMKIGSQSDLYLSLSGGVKPGLKGSLGAGAGVADNISIELRGNADLSTELKLLENNNVPEKIWNGVSFGISGEIIATAFIFQHTVPLGDLYSYTWPESQRPAIRRAFFSADDSNWQLLERTYQGKQEADLPRARFSKRGGNAPISGQTDIYPYTYPTLASNGTMLNSVWVTDDITKNAYNRTSLLFAAFNGSNWSAPQKILENGTADFYPDIAATDQGLVLAWQDTKTEFSQAPDLESMLTSQEIAVSIRNGTGEWGSQIRLTDNNNYDHHPKVAASGSQAIVTWLKSSENSLFGDANQQNSIHYAHYDGTNWSQADLVKGGLGFITSYDVVYDDNSNKPFLTYCLDTDNDLSTLNDRKIYSLYYDYGWKTETIAAGSNPRLAEQDDGSLLLLFLQNGCIMQTTLSSSNGTWSKSDVRTALAPKASGSTEYGSFILASASDGRHSLVMPVITDNGQELAASVYDKTLAEGWGEPVRITEDGGVKQFTAATVINDTLLTLFSQTSISQGDEDGEQELAATNLCYKVTTLATDPAIASSSITTDKGALVPAATTNLSVDVINKGLLASSDVEVTFYYGDPNDGGVVINSPVALAATLRGGEIQTATLADWQLPEPIAEDKSVYAVVSAKSATDSNSANNMVESDIFYRDLAVGNSHYVEKGPVERRLIFTVENNGSFDCRDISVHIKANGNKVYSADIPLLVAGKAQEIVFDLDVKDYVDNYDDFIETVIEIDPFGAISEQNEKNNSWLMNIRGKNSSFELPDGSTVFADTDNDGINDYWERLFAGNIDKLGKNSDFDGDKYSDVQEYQNFTGNIAAVDGVAYNPLQKNAPGGKGYVVDLMDIKLGLQVITGKKVNDVYITSDINDDNKIGVVETINYLQLLSKTRH